jgi:hypothetical protein
MNDELFSRIVKLIEKQMGRYKRPLNRDTMLEKDLGMTGDDTVEFLLDFSKEFNVDLSNFKISRYFYPEGDTILPAILRTATGKPDPKEAELTIGHLENAVYAGKLNEEIINKRPT